MAVVNSPGDTPPFCKEFAHPSCWLAVASQPTPPPAITMSDSSRPAHSQPDDSASSFVAAQAQDISPPVDRSRAEPDDSESGHPELGAPMDGILDSPEGEHDEVAQHYARSRIFCFHCNRQEAHFHSLKQYQRFPFYVGLSAGLVYLYGPFTCRCCGHRRHFRFDWIHPILVWRKWFVG